MLTRQDPVRGIDNNILVFDSKARMGEFTDRLIILLLDAWADNLEGKPSEIYLPSLLKPLLDTDKNKTIGGLKYIFDKRLNPNDIFYEDFFKLGATTAGDERGWDIKHAHKDPYICVVKSDQGNILLGSF